MRKITFVFLQYILVFVSVFFFTQPVSAHGDEPRLEISLDRVHPGGVIEVRGVDFEPEETVDLTLVGSEVDLMLGTVTADVEGIFLQVVTLPVDLPEGDYDFHARTDDHEVISNPFFVQGPAVLAGEAGQGPRDEDDPLLAPMPTFAPGVVPGGVSQEAVQSIPQEAPTSNRNSIVFAAITLLTVTILIIGGLRLVRKR